MIVVGSELSTPVYSATYDKGLMEVLKDLKKPGRQLIVLGQGTELAQSGPTCLSVHSSSVQSCTTSESDAVAGYALLGQSKAARSVNARFVNVTPWFCTTAICPAVIGPYEVYEDQFHVTSTYTDVLSSVLQEAMALK
jgi:hypothetical protein